MTKEVLKLALEALEVANSCIDGYYIPKGKTHLPEIELAITAIKEALAQPEHGWTPERIAGMSRLKEAQDKKLAQPESCEYCNGTGDVHSFDGEWRGVCVCKAGKALAQPEQEPVTWRYKIVDVFGRPVWTLKTPKTDIRVLESQPLYTTPPQRKPLTDEEIIDKTRWFCVDMRWPSTVLDIARAIEAAHGIKGEA